MSARFLSLPKTLRMPLPGNQALLLEGGKDFFPAVTAAIESSHRRIYLETYIYADDKSTRPVTLALMAAARRGVKVHVIVDGFGGDGLQGALVARLRDAGVRLRIYKPYRVWQLLTGGGMQRSHRKLIAIDEQIAFVGGINMLDDHEDPRLGKLRHSRFDFAVKIEGPIVWPIWLTMRRLWWFTRREGQLPTGEKFKTLWRKWRHHVSGMRSNPTAALVAQSAASPLINRVNPPQAAAKNAGVSISFLRRSCFTQRHAIERAYLKAIRSAQQEIIIASAYFAPGRRFREALCAAAKRGVRVVLLLQGQREYWAQHWAAQSLYDGMLCDGIEIYEYLPSLLHAKVAVIDQSWATVGSSNLDPFSLLLAREANVVVHDAVFARALSAALQEAIHSHSRRVPSDAHQKRKWFWRLFYALGRGLIRAFVYFVGNRRDY